MIAIDAPACWHAGFTARWHAGDSAPWLARSGDRVDGHGGRMAVLALHLWGSRASRALLVACVTHDLGEFVAGDLPWSAKRDPGLRAAAAAQKGDDDMAKGDGAKVVAMPAAAPREPTLDEKAAINEALMVSYDRKARRYLGADTDSTIAAQLGGGILPGWVAAIREQFYGPAGGNEEMEALRLDVRKALAEAEGRVDAVAQLRGEVEALARAAEAKCAGLRDLEKRLDAVIKAVGPRAGAR